jgi:multiple sugar transport system ATP-binding protein
MTGEGGAGIQLNGVRKTYAGDVHAVRGIDLQVADGELVVLLGPSGCGKSTVLRLVAGLESLTAGEIRIGDRRVDTVPAKDRDVAMVFQSYALYGHMSVRRNLEFPLRMRGIARAERRRRAEEVAALLELGPLLEQKPAALSGGQQQRVAMGRALVREPRAFLLDEPLSNLDARLRGQVRVHIAEIQRRLGVTTMYVTHDQVEALSLGHRIAVLRDGRIQQIAPGPELYDRPANAFVAQFVGQPGMNLMIGRLGRNEGGWTVDGLAGAEVPVGREIPVGVEALGTEILVGVRPDFLEIVSSTSEDPGAFTAEVRSVEAIGPHGVVYLASDVRTLDTSSTDGRSGPEGDARRGPGEGRRSRPEGDTSRGPGEGARSGPAGDGGPLLAARTDRAERVSAGDRVMVRPAPREVRLFAVDGSALFV